MGCSLSLFYKVIAILSPGEMKHCLLIDRVVVSPQLRDTDEGDLVKDFNQCVISMLFWVVTLATIINNRCTSKAQILTCSTLESFQARMELAVIKLIVVSNQSNFTTERHETVRRSGICFPNDHAMSMPCLLEDTICFSFVIQLRINFCLAKKKKGKITLTVQV